MNKTVLIPAFAALLFFSCKKKDSCDYDSCSNAAPASEIQDVQDYLTNNSITAIQHCSGVFYKIENAGTGKNPGFCSNIFFTYKGMLTNGSVFDESDVPVSYNLGGLITGWRNTLPLIKEGGKIVLYIPPSLGYGSQGQGPVPPNAITIFEVGLVAVQ